MTWMKREGSRRRRREGSKRNRRRRERIRRIRQMWRMWWRRTPRPWLYGSAKRKQRDLASWDKTLYRQRMMKMTEV
jgi:hypothetical protein